MNFSSILHVLNILASSFILSPTDNPTCAIRLIAWCCGGCLSWCKYNAFMRINESVKAVSYTHLDVYKRQSYYDYKCLVKDEEFSRYSIRLNLEHSVNKYIKLGAFTGYTHSVQERGSTPVSYTHLPTTVYYQPYYYLC